MVTVMPQYFDEEPDVGSAPATLTLQVDGRTLDLATDRGVFSRGRVDPGTAVLLRKAPPPPPRGTLLDLGCGYGAIALWLAVRAPGAEVVAVDVNRRALALVERNAAVNDVSNVVAATPDTVADRTFVAIYSNPPIRIGKTALHDLLSTWLPRLEPQGAAYLVVHRHLGADSLHAWLEQEGNDVFRLGSSKGYRVLEVRGPRAGSALE
jgi:16S rRNA (guanine1207-N2)-methyltransferase